MADRAQSEVIGFVLVFGIIMAGVVMGSVVGFSSLQSAQDFQRTANAQQAIELLAANVDAVAHDGAPSRTTELDVVDAELVIGEPVRFVVNVTNVAETDRHASYPFDVQPIIYSGADGAEVVYVNGAIIRQQTDGTVLLREPRLLVNEDRTVIQVIQTRSRHDRSVAGPGTLVWTEATEQELLVANASRHNVTVTVDTPRTAAWEAYLEAGPEVNCSRDGSVVECSVTTDQVYVTVTRISVRAK